MTVLELIKELERYAARHEGFQDKVLFMSDLLYYEPVELLHRIQTNDQGNYLVYYMTKKVNIGKS
jgi:hypothetical protein